MTWIQTRSGKAFNLLHPRAEDVDFEDVAFALAHINRFTGHVGAYSVAQHCVLGCEYLLRQNEMEAALAFLLHDAHEAYVGDLATPLVTALDRFRGGFRDLLRILKSDVDEAIFEAAGLDLPSNAVAVRVKEIDFAMLLTERDQLLGRPPERWAGEQNAPAPLPIRIDLLTSPDGHRRHWLGLLRRLAPQTQASS